MIAQDGRQAELRPGELTFYDTRRPYEGTLGTDAGRSDAG